MLPRMSYSLKVVCKSDKKRNMNIPKGLVDSADVREPFEHENRCDRLINTASSVAN